MKYDDLLNIPFKHLGRDKTGYDCYGLVIECCRRAGKPLKDYHKKIFSLPTEEINDYISSGLNLRQIDKAKVGCIVLSEYKGNTHVGYIVEREKVLHATIDKGVKISPLFALHPIAYYEVIDESNVIQNTIERKNIY